MLITDKTRATPNRLVLSLLLPKVSSLVEKRKKEDVKVVVANGLHKPSREKTMKELVGDEVFEEYEVIEHDSDAPGQVYIGKTSRGTEFYLNKEVATSDVVIATGLIEPHFFAGYSGGRKLVFPGVSSTKSVYQNHNYEKIAHPKVDYGFLEGNPIHEDFVEAAKMLRSFSFILNVILDEEKRLIKAFSGDPFDAHLQGLMNTTALEG